MPYCSGTDDLHEVDELTATPLSLMNLGKRGTRKEAGGEVRKGGQDTTIPERLREKIEIRRSG